MLDHPSAHEIARIRRLPLFEGAVAVSPLPGGITNRNFLAADARGRFVVRFGEDLPVHGVMRFNELAAARAAEACGLSPGIVFDGPGVMVTRFIDARALEPADLRDPSMILRVAELLRRCHHDVLRAHRGPVLAFWAFQVIRSYLATLGGEPCRIAHRLSGLGRAAALLEARVGPVTLAFGHNDLLAANILDDGARLWLIDWDYAGLNTPLFDLANLSSNNALTDDLDRLLLVAYLGEEPSEALLGPFAALKCASLLREALWSAASETRSRIAFDYGAYTDDCLARFEAAMERLGPPC